MKAAIAVLLGLALVAGVARSVRADDDAAHSSYHAVIDRVELEPASITGLRLRVYLSALAIGGQLLDLSDPKSIKLYIGQGEKKYPYALGTYDATGGDTEIIVLVQVTADFSDSLGMIADAINTSLLGHLSDKTKIAIATFGDSASAPKLDTAKQLRGKVSLATDGSSGDPALSDAIDRALLVLKKLPADSRKMIVVVGDGRDSAGDHDRVTSIGERAAKEGVRIHSLAYSPADLRRPLLVLGEYSKRSLGTLRWPGQGHKPTADTWSESFAQLAQEVDKQHVLTFFAPDEDDVAGKKLHIVTVGRTEATSNEMKIPEVAACPTCTLLTAPANTGHPILKWLAIIGGGIVGLVVLLGAIGFAMSKSQSPKPMPMPGQLPGMPGQLPVPGSVPPSGKRSKAASQAPAPAPGLLPTGRPIPGLMILNGARAGERLMLRHGFWIGKQPGCDLQIEDGYTSSQHAQILMDNAGNCRLFDHNSTNGTFINNQRVTNDVPLVHGSTIRIGSIELRFLAQ